MQAAQQAQFVQWFRAAAPYVHAFGGRTFVIAFGGEVVADGHFIALSHDLNLLASLGVRLVLVHGARPQIDAQITAQRRWHRRQLEHILRDAKPGLLLPLPQAVAIAFVLTNPDTWRALTEESGLSQPKAIALTTTTLDAALFGHQPG